mgnify:CR=1 FL=1
MGYKCGKHGHIVVRSCQCELESLRAQVGRVMKEVDYALRACDPAISAKVLARLAKLGKEEGDKP